MKFFHVATRLYQKPWVITAGMHKRICSIIEGHFNGSAHKSEDLFGGEEEDKSILTKKDGIAVIKINGVLAKGVSGIMKSSGMVDTNEVYDVLKEVQGNGEYQGVLLDVDSPGGEVTGIPEVAALIQEIKVDKPVVAQTSNLMCSGAYWIASAASAIIASPSAAVGSIGVYMTLLDSSARFEKEGLKQELIKAGTLKGAGIEGTTLSEEQRKSFQDEVNFLHAWFRADVRAGRGDVEDSVMEGQSMFAVRAVEANLVDGIGELGDALEEVKDLVNAKINEVEEDKEEGDEEDNLEENE